MVAKLVGSLLGSLVVAALLGSCCGSGVPEADGIETVINAPTAAGAHDHWTTSGGLDLAFYADGTGVRDLDSDPLVAFYLGRGRSLHNGH